ncbi:glycosyltransferase family 2 protein [Patescibacteria group bacterium]|nr:glycosyltransferase family 2 protein [Patescibacteria group bacterium]
MKNSDHFLSVIVPIYKQEQTILTDIKGILSTLDQIRYDYELIAVVDGTLIDHSYQELKRSHLPKLKLYGYPHNHGKGFAVRYGMARTKGDYIAFIDAGMEIDPNGISMVIEHLEWYEADIVVASKLHPASRVQYPTDRKIISLGARIIARILLNIKVSDTQAGLKIFKRQVLEKVLPRLMVKNYAFDLEILSVANYLGFFRIYEAPIKLSYNFKSLTHATGMKTVITCLIDALAVFYRLKILHYYDNHNQRQWIFDKELSMRINTGL